MKYVTENIPEIDKVALTIMLFSTCGEDEDTMANTEIEQIGPSIYHVTYSLDDPLNAMDFQVAIEPNKSELGATLGFHYTVFRSMYADDGEFSIKIN